MSTSGICGFESRSPRLFQCLVFCVKNSVSECVDSEIGSTSYLGIFIRTNVLIAIRSFRNRVGDTHSALVVSTVT